MPLRLDERVAYLEERMEGLLRVWKDSKDMMINDEAKMIAFEQRIDRRI